MSSKKRRKRRPPPAAPASTAPRAPERTAKRAVAKPIEEQRPPAPWGDFPLVELVVLVGLVMLLVGLFIGGSRGPVMIVTGLVLASLAGLELSVREHFGGFRSHTTLLAGVVAVLTLVVLYYLVGLESGVSLGGALVAFAIAFALLAQAFRARTGRLLKLR